MGDALANRLDHARAFHAQGHRQGQRVDTAALVDVDEVQAAGVMADADLAGAGLADLRLDKLHVVRPPNSSMRMAFAVVVIGGSLVVMASGFNAGVPQIAPLAGSAIGRRIFPCRRRSPCVYSPRMSELKPNHGN
jgi:hypothetical protein